MMDYDHYFVALVKGSNPEQFFVGFYKQGLPGNPFMKTTDFMLEDKMREHLKKEMQRTDAEIDALMQKARTNPV